MEKHKTCSFFGHRNAPLTDALTQTLKNLINHLIVDCGVNVFLFGSRSQFNHLCHLVVTELKEIYPFVKRISYTCKSEACTLENNRKAMERRYSSFAKKDIFLLGVEEEFEHDTKYTCGKASYVARNQAMINDSDYCVFYYDKDYQPEKRKLSNRGLGYYQPKSGTAIAYTYAIQKKKVLINLFGLL